jgi:hypothetical protein
LNNVAENHVSTEEFYAEIAKCEKSYRTLRTWGENTVYNIVLEGIYVTKMIPRSPIIGQVS